jgi:hypothetical protein
VKHDDQVFNQGITESETLKGSNKEMMITTQHNWLITYNKGIIKFPLKLDGQWLRLLFAASVAHV